MRRRAEAAPVHALPPSVRLPVYRLPPLAVPEGWRVARGDGSVLSQLPQPRTAAEPPADATKAIRALAHPLDFQPGAARRAPPPRVEESAWEFEDDDND